MAIDTIVVSEEPALGTTEHDLAMIAKAEEGMAAPVDKPLATAATRPEGIPDKFWNAETGVDVAGLAKSYTELEKLKSGTPAEAKPAAAAPADPAVVPADVTEVVGIEAFSKEFAEKGELSADSYAALAKQGLSKAIVDGYIDGQKAIASQQEVDGFAVAGGKENYTAMSKWAGAALSAGEIDAFNKGLEGSPDSRNLAIAGLHAKWQAAVGAEPNLMGAHGANGATGAQYDSWAQVTEAMKNPKYQNDSAYRDMVQKTIANSPKL